VPDAEKELFRNRRAGGDGQASAEELAALAETAPAQFLEKLRENMRLLASQGQWTTERGSFAGDAYSGGNVRNVLVLDDRDTALILTQTLIECPDVVTLAESMGLLEEGSTVADVTRLIQEQALQNHRSVSIARKAGFAHVCGIAAPSTALFLPNNLARESLALAQDFVTGKL
jgi:hypothetical protein